MYVLFATEQNPGNVSTFIDILRDLVPNADPDIILLDFELAARNAFKDIFPRTDVDGCFFHLCESVHRKLVSLGLKNLYETDVEFNTLVKSLPYLAFVTLVEVEIQRVALFPDEENVQLPLFYFESTYIIHRGLVGLVREARFPPKDWNFFLSAG